MLRSQRFTDPAVRRINSGFGSSDHARRQIGDVPCKRIDKAIQCICRQSSIPPAVAFGEIGIEDRRTQDGFEGSRASKKSRQIGSGTGTGDHAREHFVLRKSGVASCRTITLMVPPSSGLTIWQV